MMMMMMDPYSYIGLFWLVLDSKKDILFMVHFNKLLLKQVGKTDKKCIGA